MSTQTSSQRTERERIPFQIGVSLNNIIRGDIFYDGMSHRNLLVTGISPVHVNLVFRRGLSNSPITIETRELVDYRLTNNIKSSQTYDSSGMDKLRSQLYQTADQFLMEAGI